MLDALITSFYLETSSVLEHSIQDQIEDHRSHMIWEPRWELGLGFDIPVTKKLNIDVGYSVTNGYEPAGFNAFSPSPNDKYREVHVTFRYSPFKKQETQVLFRGKEDER